MTVMETETESRETTEMVKTEISRFQKVGALVQADL